MDFSEVNFELTQGVARHNDQQTFREILEQVCHQVNQPDFEHDMMFETKQQNKTL